MKIAPSQVAPSNADEKRFVLVPKKEGDKRFVLVPDKRFVLVPDKRFVLVPKKVPVSTSKAIVPAPSKAIVPVSNKAIIRAFKPKKITLPKKGKQYKAHKKGDDYGVPNDIPEHLPAKPHIPKVFPKGRKGGKTQEQKNYERRMARTQNPLRDEVEFVRRKHFGKKHQWAADWSADLTHSAAYKGGFLNDVREVLNRYKKLMAKSIYRIVHDEYQSPLRLKLSIGVVMENQKNHKKQDGGFVTSNFIDVSLTNTVEEIEKKIEGKIEELVKLEEGYIEHGSGWIVVAVETIDFHVLENLLDIGSGMAHRETPDWVPNNAVINVKNTDNECFRYAVLAAIFCNSHPTPKYQNVTVYNGNKKPESYPNFDEIKFDGMKFPVTLRDIDKFEALNPRVKVNVYSCFSLEESAKVS